MGSRPMEKKTKMHRMIMKLILLGLYTDQVLILRVLVLVGLALNPLKNYVPMTM